MVKPATTGAPAEWPGTLRASECGYVPAGASYAFGDRIPVPDGVECPRLEGKVPGRNPGAEPPSDDAGAQTWHYSAEAVVIRRLATRRKETQMGLDDLAKKAGDALSSDKAEAISDKALDAAAGAAKKATGGKYDDKIDAARDAVDGKLGTE